MRVVEVLAPLKVPAAGAAPRRDAFAALSTGPLPAIGGYRILRSRPAVRRAPRHAHRLPRRDGARLHASGFLSVLLIGGLGLAALTGPASCPCEHEPAAAADTRDGLILARFDYTKPSRLGRDRSAAKLVQLRLAGFVPPFARLAAPAPVAAQPSTSPITTAAIAPADELPAQNPARVAGFVASPEPLADVAPPPIRLAAAAPDAGTAATLSPVTVVTQAPGPEVETVEVGRTKPEATAERRARPSHTRRKRSARAKRPSAGPKVAQAPRWAMQMFETPWQSKAFSYIQ